MRSEGQWHVHQRPVASVHVSASLPPASQRGVLGSSELSSPAQLAPLGFPTHLLPHSMATLNPRGKSGCVKVEVGCACSWYLGRDHDKSCLAPNWQHHGKAGGQRGRSLNLCRGSLPAIPDLGTG